MIGALETLDLEAAQRYRTSLLGSIAGGLAAAGGAVVDAGKEAADRATNPWWIWGVAAIVLGVVVIQSRR
jgi:hypothetical protein